MNTLDILIQRLAEERDIEPAELTAKLAPMLVVTTVSAELAAARERGKELR